MSDKQPDEAGFIDKALGSVPRWAMAVIGILFATAIFLAFSGLNSAVIRVANAYATRIEKAVVLLEEVAARLTVLEMGSAVVQKTLGNHEQRIIALEKDTHKK